MASRTSILETIPKIISSPVKIKAKSTISNFEKFFFDIRSTISSHKYLSLGFALGVLVFGVHYGRGRVRRSRGGFFRLDGNEKDGLLGGTGKVD
jgi:protein disulfide-isomerase